MIGQQMSRHGLRSRAFTWTFGAVAVVGAAFCAALMVIPSEGAVQKIGPGYAHMQPIDHGKAEKIAYSVPYSIPVRHAPKTKPVRAIADPVLAEFFAVSPPVMVAVAQPSYSRDIHRVY
jgi:hypothetical protein